MKCVCVCVYVMFNNMFNIVINICNNHNMILIIKKNQSNLDFCRNKTQTGTKKTNP